MHSPEHSTESRGGNISSLISFFDNVSTESDRNQTATRHDPFHYETTQETTKTTEEVIQVVFEKRVGRLQDFKFYYGRNNRGVTGLFIRSVTSESPLADKIKRDDQILKVNDEDVKNLESDALNYMLDNLSGTVRLEVMRIKHDDRVNRKQELEEFETKMDALEERPQLNNNPGQNTLKAMEGSSGKMEEGFSSEDFSDEKGLEKYCNLLYKTQRSLNENAESIVRTMGCPPVEIGVFTNDDESLKDDIIPSGDFIESLQVETGVFTNETQQPYYPRKRITRQIPKPRTLEESSTSSSDYGGDFFGKTSEKDFQNTDVNKENSNDESELQGISNFVSFHQQLTEGALEERHQQNTTGEQNISEGGAQSHATPLVMKKFTNEKMGEEMDLANKRQENRNNKSGLRRIFSFGSKPKTYKKGKRLRNSSDPNERRLEPGANSSSEPQDAYKERHQQKTTVEQNISKGGAQSHATPLVMKKFTNEKMGEEMDLANKRQENRNNKSGLRRILSFGSKRKTYEKGKRLRNLSDPNERRLEPGANSSSEPQDALKEKHQQNTAVEQNILKEEGASTPPVMKEFTFNEKIGIDLIDNNRRFLDASVRVTNGTVSPESENLELVSQERAEDLDKDNSNNNWYLRRSMPSSPSHFNKPSKGSNFASDYAGTENSLLNTDSTCEHERSRHGLGRGKRTPRKSPRKNVDDIKDIRQMLDLFGLLRIDHDPNKLDLSEMKRTAKKVINDQRSGSGKYSNGTTGFEVITKAKDEDMLKRKELENFYFQVEDCVMGLDQRAIDILNTYCNGHKVLDVLVEKRERLMTNKKYNVLIAGESSAGKSSLVNLILGEELLAHHILCTTSTICEIKFGEERRLVAHYKYDGERKTGPLPKIYDLKPEQECGKSHYDQISEYVKIESGARKEGSKYERVEIFWPHELLKEGVVIVDSPGLGESDEMDEMLMQCLSNAFAFIYVLDVSRAGGMQKDIKNRLMDIIKKAQSPDNSEEPLQHLAECSLFIGNKWDLVKEGERSATKKHVVAKLRECWENSTLNHQIVYMSIADAIKVQEYDGVTEEFNELLQKIKSIILTAMKIRLYNHWQWLYALVQEIFIVTYSHIRIMESSRQKTCEEMKAIEINIENIERGEQDARKNMEKEVEYWTDILYEKMDRHIHSTDFKTKFCNWSNWSNLFVPSGKTWEKTKNNVEKAIDYRFKELLIQWENDNHVYSQIHRELLDNLFKRLNVLEEELQGVDEAMHSVEKQGDHLKYKSKISTTTKVLFGATSPLWIPFGVAGLVIGMPVFGAMAVKRKVDERKKLEDYKKNPRDYLKKRSEEYLAQLEKDYVLAHAQYQMENTRTVISKYIDQIPILIEVNRKLLKNLTSETRSQREVLNLYDPINEKSVSIIDYITHLGLDLFPATVNESDLEWKEEKNSCLGEGEFSIVYQGKLKNAGGGGAKSLTPETKVAVKVFRDPFDDANSRLFLDEEVRIRDLEHKNVLKHFGATRITNSASSYEYKFIFVMEKGRENLRKAISRSPAPANSKNYTQAAVGKFMKRAMDIAEGLNYIHERGLVHRHLKLKNILEDEKGTAMISDVGIVGQFLETEKSIIYLAPEVLDNLTNRTKQADIYSYGIVLWEMWYGTQAFTELMPIKKAEFQIMIANGKRPNADDKKISIPAIYDVMKSCWATEVERRYSAEECSRKFQEIKKKLTQSSRC